MKVIKGNLIDLAESGEFDVIAHGCNCFNTQGAGIAKAMAKNFNTSNFPMETQGRGDYNKLGQIDYQEFSEGLFGKLGQTRWRGDNKYGFNNHITKLIVVNCYTQYRYGTNTRQLDYEALTLCFKKLNHIFKGKKLGLPWIGCGLAGGDKNRVKEIMIETLSDVDLTIVEL